MVENLNEASTKGERFIKTKQMCNMYIPVRFVCPAPSISEVSIRKVLQTGKIRKTRDF